jgi:hypothetical protein
MNARRVKRGWLPRRPVALSKLESRLVWIAGSPRTGSTWLANLIADDRRCVRIFEPLIGLHLGVRSTAVAHVPEQQLVETPRILDLRTDDHYFFAAQRSELWGPLLRKMILRRFSADFRPEAEAYVVHEPNGSDGVDIIMRSLPRSRLLFLMRDPRDVIDSILDSYRTGSWLDMAFGVGRDLTPRDRVDLIKIESYRWLTRTRIVQKAFDEHDPRLRYCLRYEDLLSDTPTELASVLVWMNLAPAADLRERVARHSFASIPAADKGAGKFHRAATPGLWRETWTAEEERVCGAILDPTLREYGYSGRRPT